MSQKRAHDDSYTGPDAKVAALEVPQLSAPSTSSGQSHVNVPTPPIRRQGEPVHSRNTYVPSGVVTSMAGAFAGPAPCHCNVYVVVQSVNFTQYFNSLYNVIVRMLFPILDPAQAVGLITEAHFALVCRYLMKARCDHVYGKVSGRRPARRIPIPTEFYVPNALALILNGIGTLTVNNGALFVIPEPEAVDAANPNQNLDVLVDHNMLAAFTWLVKSAEHRGMITLGVISTMTPGQAYWLLTARDPLNAANVAAQDANHCQVYSVFREWQPSDALLASIALNQFNGLFGGINELMWTTDPSRSISIMRAQFNADA